MRLRVAVNQRKLALDLGRLVGEDHLAKHLRLFRLIGAGLYEVLDYNLRVLEDDLSQVDDPAAREVRDVAGVGAVARHEGDDARVELLLDLVKALVGVAAAENYDNEARVACLFQQAYLFLRVVDVHFSLAAKRHDKTAHGLLSELCLVLSISHDQVVPRDAIDCLLRVLLEELPLLELSHVRVDERLVLDELDALFQVIFVELLDSCGWRWFEAELRRCAVGRLGSLRDAKKPGNELRVLDIADLVKLVDLQITHVVLEVRIVLPTDEEVKKGVEDVRLQERNDEELSLVCRVEDSDLLGEILRVLLFGFGVVVEADRVEATLVNDDVEAAILVCQVQEVHLGVGHTRDVPLVHLLDDFRNKINAFHIGLVHLSAELFREQRVPATWHENPRRLALDEPILEVRHQVSELGVPLEGLHVRALIVLVDLLRSEEVRPELLGLEFFGVFALEIECSQFHSQPVVILILVRFDHLKRLVCAK